MILNLTFSPTDNAQYVTVFKLGTRKCENPILTGHYILHSQPAQPKSCTCFYADYVSFLGENIYTYTYILSPEKGVLLMATEESGLKLNADIAKHIT